MSSWSRLQLWIGLPDNDMGSPANITNQTFKRTAEATKQPLHVAKPRPLGKSVGRETSERRENLEAITTTIFAAVGSRAIQQSRAGKRNGGVLPYSISAILKYIRSG
jgi:hypothetical protein